MRTFIYKITPLSSKRGYNRTISVYEIVNNEPRYLGFDDKISTGSYKGDYAIVSKIISENTDLLMKDDNYSLVEDCRLINI